MWKSSREQTQVRIAIVFGVWCYWCNSWASSAANGTRYRVSPPFARSFGGFASTNTISGVRFYNFEGGSLTRYQALIRAHRLFTWSSRFLSLKMLPQHSQNRFPQDVLRDAQAASVEHIDGDALHREAGQLEQRGSHDYVLVHQAQEGRCRVAIIGLPPCKLTKIHPSWSSSSHCISSLSGARSNLQSRNESSATASLREVGEEHRESPTCQNVSSWAHQIAAIPVRRGVLRAICLPSKLAATTP